MSPFQRTGHRIKLNHSNAIPRYIISLVADSIKSQSEDGARLHNRYFAGVSVCAGRYAEGRIVGRQTVDFSDRNELWKYLYSFTRINYTTWIIGHNILTDLILCGLPDRFARGELSIDKARSKRKVDPDDSESAISQTLAVLECPPTIIGCRVGETQGRVVIVDILNWLSGSILEIEQATGPEKVAESLEGDSCNILRPLRSSQAESLHRAFVGVIEWVKSNDMGMFRYTSSSQAIGAFRHRFMRHAIYVHDCEPVQKLERAAYIGGRSDVFRIGDFTERVHQVDCNALFPAVMRDGWFPYCLHRYHLRRDYLDRLPAIDWSASVAEVQLCTKSPIYPLRTDSHVIFPTGIFHTTLCGVELQRAYKAGEIVKIRSWSEYKLARLFETWVDVLWKMRQEYRSAGNDLYCTFTKKIMNSLYGKFAQLTPAWVNCPNDLTMLPFTTEMRRDGATGEWTKYRSIGWQTQKLAKRVERPGSFYAISAFVTALARSRMDNLRAIAGQANCYYQGVDGLIVTDVGSERLEAAGEIAADKLGKLRIQESADYGTIRGISDYQVGGKVVLSSRAAMTETASDGSVLQHRFYVMDHLFKRGPIDTIIERTEEWIRKSPYKKGQVRQDGWVEPFELGATPISASLGSGIAAAAAPDSSSTSVP